MSSWVRYSITVYIGLLISGSLAQTPSHAPGTEPAHTPSAKHAAPAQTLPPPTNQPEYNGKDRSA